MLVAMLGATLLATTGCKGGGDGSTTSTGAGGNNSTASTGAGGSFLVDAGVCSADPLRTGLPALFNGNSVDMYDCLILTYTAKYNEPDAMIFKAIVYVE